MNTLRAFLIALSIIFSWIQSNLRYYSGEIPESTFLTHFKFKFRLMISSINRLAIDDSKIHSNFRVDHRNLLELIVIWRANEGIIEIYKQIIYI